MEEPLWEEIRREVDLEKLELTEEERKIIERLGRKVVGDPVGLSPFEKRRSIIALLKLIEKLDIGPRSNIRKLAFQTVKRGDTSALYRVIMSILLTTATGRLKELEERVQHFRPSKSNAGRLSRELLNIAGELAYGRRGHPLIPSIHLLEAAGAIHPRDAQRVRAGNHPKKELSIEPFEVRCCGYKVVVGIESLFNILHAYDKIFSSKSPHYINPGQVIWMAEAGRIETDRVLDSVGGAAYHLGHVLYNKNVVPVIVYNNKGEPVGRFTLYVKGVQVYFGSMPVGIAPSHQREIVEHVARELGRRRFLVAYHHLFDYRHHPTLQDTQAVSEKHRKYTEYCFIDDRIWVCEE